MKPKLCADCDLYKEVRCHRRDPYPTNMCARHVCLVTGEPTDYCRVQRMWGRLGSLVLGQCGEHGRYWRQRT